MIETLRTLEASPVTFRALRRLVGWSQTEAGRQVGRSLRTVQGWEAGDRGIDPALWELYLSKVRRALRDTGYGDAPAEILAGYLDEARAAFEGREAGDVDKARR